MSARVRAGAKKTSDGDPVHSLRTLIDDLATITRNTVAPRIPGAPNPSRSPHGPRHSRGRHSSSWVFSHSVPSNTLLKSIECHSYQTLALDRRWCFGLGGSELTFRPPAFFRQTVEFASTIRPAFLCHLSLNRECPSSHFHMIAPERQ